MMQYAMRSRGDEGDLKKLTCLVGRPSIRCSRGEEDYRNASRACIENQGGEINLGAKCSLALARALAITTSSSTDSKRF